MGADIISSSLVLDSLQDRLREAESNVTVPLREAYSQWKQRAAEREARHATVSLEQEPLGVSIGKVIAVAAAVAAAAAVYKALSSQSPTPQILREIHESLPEYSSTNEATAAEIEDRLSAVENRTPEASSY
jgi:hypothetical protein